MSTNNRNPFAEWGYDMSFTYKPSENENFTQTFTTPISELTEEEMENMYNETATVAPFNKTATQVFFRNDENMQEVELQTPAYGFNKEFQITFGGEVVESDDTTEGGNDNTTEGGENPDGSDNTTGGGDDNTTNGGDNNPEGTQTTGPVTGEPATEEDIP